MASITLENLNKTYPNGFVSVKSSIHAAIDCFAGLNMVH